MTVGGGSARPNPFCSTALSLESAQRNSFCSIPTFLTCHRSIAWLSLMPPPALAPHVAHTSTSNRAPGARPQSDMLSQPQAAAASSAATSAAVLAVAHVRREWVFMNITPHITIRNKPWTVWGF